MSLVVVQRTFDEAQELSSVQAKENAVTWCLQERRVSFLCTFFSLDHKRMVCIYDAPDAESVRYTQRKAGLPVDDCWAAESFMAAIGQPVNLDVGAKTIVVVERIHDQPATMAQAIEGAESGAWCFDANDIEAVESYVAAAGNQQVCIFAAPDAESVRKANRTTQSAFEHAWSATVFKP